METVVRHICSAIADLCHQRISEGCYSVSSVSWSVENFCYRATFVYVASAVFYHQIGVKWVKLVSALPGAHQNKIPEYPYCLYVKDYPWEAPFRYSGKGSMILFLYF